MSLVNILLFVFLVIPLMTFNFIKLYQIQQVGVIEGKKYEKLNAKILNILKEESERAQKELYNESSLLENNIFIKKIKYHNYESLNHLIKAKRIEYKATIDFLVDNKINTQNYKEFIYETVLFVCNHYNSFPKKENHHFKSSFTTIEHYKKQYNNTYSLLTCLYIVTDKDLSKMSKVIKMINNETISNTKSYSFISNDFIENVKSEIDDYNVKNYTHKIEELENKNGIDRIVWKNKVRLLTMLTSMHIVLQNYIKKLQEIMDKEPFTLKYFTSFSVMMFSSIFEFLFLRGIINRIDKQIIKGIKYDDFISSYSLPDAPPEIIYNIIILPYLNIRNKNEYV